MQWYPQKTYFPRWMSSWCVPIDYSNHLVHNDPRFGMPICSTLRVFNVTPVSYALCSLSRRWYSEGCARLPRLRSLKEVGITFASSLVRHLAFATPSIIYPMSRIACQRSFFSRLPPQESQSGRQRQTQHSILWRMRCSVYSRRFCVRNVIVRLKPVSQPLSVLLVSQIQG
jgi:hypothetical protein